MDEFDIQSNWVRPIESLPVSGTRCIVTDGDLVLIATYISDNNESVWMLTGLEESSSKSFDVQGWMPLPKTIKKLVKANEVTSEEIKRDGNQ